LLLSAATTRVSECIGMIYYLHESSSQKDKTIAAGHMEHHDHD